MTRSRTSLSLGIGVLTLGLLTACGGARTDSPPGDRNLTIRYGIAGAVHSFDPRQTSPFDTAYLNQVYETLIGVTEDGGYKPGLAESWAYDPDQNTFTFTLTTGRKFQDGADFNADAVKANIESAKGPSSTLSQYLSVVSAVNVIDPTHVELQLSGPGGHLTGVFASFAGMMISPNALDNPDLKNKPVGTGPFQVTAVTQTKVAYERWDGHPKAASMQVKNLEIQAFTDTTAMIRAIVSGQLDGGTIASAYIGDARAAGLNVAISPVSKFDGLILNTSRGALANPLVRKALNHAIDRNTIAEAIYNGNAKPTAQPYPASYWAADASLNDHPANRYDPELAKRLLAEAGYPNGFSFEISAVPQPTYQRESQALQAALGEIGITVTLKTVATLATIQSQGDYDAIMGAVEAVVPDPTVFISNYYLPGGVYYRGNLDIPNATELLAESRASADPEARSGAIRSLLEASLEAGPPVIPIVAQSRAIALADGISGLEITILSDMDFSGVKKAA